MAAKRIPWFAVAALAGAAGPWGLWAGELEVVDRLRVQGGIEVSTSSTASPLIFASSTTSPGNVGIGTTSPSTKLDVAGTMSATQITCPGCTAMQVRVAGSCAAGNGIRTVNQDGTVVCEVGTPASIIMLSTSTCPSGFQELTSFAGRFIKGVPVGGTVGSAAVVGTPLGELALLPAHAHGYTPAGSVSSPFAGTGGTVISFDLAHTHTADYAAVGTAGPSATNCPRSSEPCGNTGDSGHSHTSWDIPNFTIGGSGVLTNSHTFTPAGTVTSSFTGSGGATVSTDHTPPYRQVRLCIRI